MSIDSHGKLRKKLENFARTCKTVRINAMGQGYLTGRIVEVQEDYLDFKLTPSVDAGDDERNTDFVVTVPLFCLMGVIATEQVMDLNQEDPDARKKWEKRRSSWLDPPAPPQQARPSVDHPNWWDKGGK